MLSDWDAPYIQSLVKQIETQSKTTLAQWAIDYAEHALLPLWSKHYPDDSRPWKALDAARDWLAGAIKLPQAKPVILECHAAARETEGNSVAQAAARAIGQCASTIHSARHCIGLALYGALAVAYDTLGTKATWISWSNVRPKSAEVCLTRYALCRLITSRTRLKLTGSADGRH
jgi:hypothetical protein